MPLGLGFGVVPMGFVDLPVPILANVTAPLGRKTRSAGTVIQMVTQPGSGAVDTWAITLGNSAGHFAIDAVTGKITVTATGQDALLSFYTLTVTATNENGQGACEVQVNTEANAYDVVTGAELIAAVTHAVASPTVQSKVYVKDGYTIADNGGNIRVIVSGKIFSGTLVDPEAGKTIAQLKATHDPASVASFTGGSCMITCRTPFAGKIRAQLEILGSSKIWLKDLDFGRTDVGFDLGRSTFNLQVTRNSTFTTAPVVIIQNCKFGRPDLASAFWTCGLTANAADVLIIEDCDFDYVWTAMSCPTMNRLVVRRVWVGPNRNEDCLILYGTNSASVPGITLKRTEVTDYITTHRTVDGSAYHATLHCDAIQCNTPAENVPSEHFWRRCILFSPQAFFAEGSPALVHHSGYMGNILACCASPNGFSIMKCDAAGGKTMELERITVVKDTRYVDTGGNGNARMIYGKGSGQTMTNCIMAAVLDATSAVQPLYTSDAAIPSDPATMNDTTSVWNQTGNVYVDHRQNNVGASNSYPEFFDGPWTTFAGAGNPGWQWNFMEPEDMNAVDFKAHCDAVFAPKAGGPAVGKGYFG